MSTAGLSDGLDELIRKTGFWTRFELRSSPLPLQNFFFIILDPSRRSNLGPLDLEKKSTSRRFFQIGPRTIGHDLPLAWANERSMPEAHAAFLVCIMACTCISKESCCVRDQRLCVSGYKTLERPKECQEVSPGSPAGLPVGFHSIRSFQASPRSRSALDFALDLALRLSQGARYFGGVCACSCLWEFMVQPSGKSLDFSFCRCSDASKRAADRQ